MKNIVNIRKVKTYQPFTSDSIFSNELYIYKNKLYKVYSSSNDYKLDNFYDKKESFIDYLINLNALNTLDDCILPIGKIYDSKKNMVGIFMKYYRDYFNLYSILNKNIKSKLKLQILKSISKGLEHMHINSICHGDINLGNIITNINDSKIIDLDEAYFLLDNADYHIKIDIMNFLTVILSVLYNFDLENTLPFNPKEKRIYINEFLNKINLLDEFKDYIKDIYFSSSDNYDYPIKFLNKIDYEKLDYDNQKSNSNNKIRKILKKV